ncbi:MAG: BREX-4 system phosphatase PglZ [Abditibacteriota bacterium]|nr:BREX-4 system phosphatase PglZ [Abditibacteriota bacterium]
MEDFESVKINIDNYFSSKEPFPFFLSINGTEEYKEVLNQYPGIQKIYISDYCNEDSFIDSDKLINYLSQNNSKCLLLGLGDYISLSYDTNIFERISNLCISGKLLVLCKGIKNFINSQSSIDDKFDNRRYYIVNSSCHNNTIIKVKFDIEYNNAIYGFKQLLKKMENCDDSKFIVRTELHIKNDYEITSYYDALKYEKKISNITEDVLSQDLWKEFYKDERLTDYKISHWRFYLKVLLNGTKDEYLCEVIKKSPNYDTYKQQIYNCILDIDCSDKRFDLLYEKRKILLKDLNKNAPELDEYLLRTKDKSKDRVYYLTDNTDKEKYEIIEEICKFKEIPKNLINIYPDLNKYLQNYKFETTDSEIYTEYFNQYKKQKLLNYIEPEFLNKVIDLANKRIYNTLETNYSVIEKYKNGNNFLYWIDALGVEFLGYIQKKAYDKGLNINFIIARCILPSLTSLNSFFYNEWKGKKTANKNLDKNKHEGDNRFNYLNKKTPIHLVEELKIISEALDFAKSELTQHNFEKVIIASDHGSSRLAVINEQENKWVMKTKGEHSGRCCPVDELSEKPEVATNENNYYVLANYDRFKGGRKASVEVHGGATLEEVLVPIIEISLLSGNIDFPLDYEPKIIKCGPEHKPEITLFVPVKSNNVILRINSYNYNATPIDDSHYKVVLDDIVNTGEYTADVIVDNNIKGSITFKTQNIIASSNDSDSFFEDF